MEIYLGIPIAAGVIAFVIMWFFPDDLAAAIWKRFLILLTPIMLPGRLFLRWMGITDRRYPGDS